MLKIHFFSLKLALLYVFLTLEYPGDVGKQDTSAGEDGKDNGGDGKDDGEDGKDNGGDGKDDGDDGREGDDGRSSMNT